jgi:hypothetical protein
LVASAAAPLASDKALVDRLCKTLRLTAEQLWVFLKAWDLTAFGSTSRLVMKSEVISGLAGMVDANARDQANLLHKRIATLMLP